MEFRDKEYDVFRMFDKQWALATAGTIEDYDGCTIGWGILGTKSKRNVDKFALTELTPQQHGQSVIFKEATLTFVCRKIYWDQFRSENLDLEIMKQIYSDRPLHYQFIGEIMEVIDKRQQA